MTVYTKIYVPELVSHKWYVGSTYRTMEARLREHEQGYGSIWTSRHPVKRCVFSVLVSRESCTELEDNLTEQLMVQFGITNVRGGNHVNCRADCYAHDFWKPKSLRFGNVPPLHYRPVSKFPLEFGRLIDTFERCRRLEDADKLNPKPLADAPLRGIPGHDEMSLAGQLVEPALCAK